MRGGLQSRFKRLSEGRTWAKREVCCVEEGHPNLLGSKARGVVQARVVIGWMAFAMLIGLSMRRLISDGELTLEVWIYLLLMPAALATAMTSDSFWNRSDAEPVELVEEEEEADVVGTKDAPDPIEDGFDVPVL